MTKKERRMALTDAKRMRKEGEKFPENFKSGLSSMWGKGPMAVSIFETLEFGRCGCFLAWGRDWFDALSISLTGNDNGNICGVEKWPARFRNRYEKAATVRKQYGVMADLVEYAVARDVAKEKR